MDILELIRNGEYSKAYEEAYALFKSDDYDAAYEIFDEIYEDVCEKKGRNSIEAYEKLLKLGHLCYEGNRFDEALTHFYTCISFVNENNYELDTYPDVIGKMANIYTIYGEYDKAVEVLNELLTYSLDAYGDNSRHVVHALRCLAETYYKSGNYTEALEYFRQVKEYAENTEGCEYEKIFSVQSIGRIYDDLGERDKALDILQQAYDIAVDEYGEESVDSLSILNDIAGIFQTIGDLDKSLELKKRVLDTAVRLFGDNDHNTQMAKINLGNLYHEMGDYEQALKLKMSACEWFEQNLGEEHESTLFAMTCLKNAFACLGKNDKELEICERLCQIYEKTRGKYDSHTLEAYKSLAYAYNRNNNISAGYDCAELAYNRALEQYEEEYPVTCSMLEVYIGACYKQGNCEQVSGLCRKYLDISQKMGINEYYSLEYIYNILASAESELGRKDEARRAAEKCLEIGFMVAGNRYTPFYLNDMNDMAFVYADIGEGEKALEMIETVLKERKERNITYPNSYSAKDTYAHVLITLGRYDDAEKVLNDTIAECGEEIILVYRMAELYHKKGDNAKALEYAEHTLELANKTLDSESGMYKDILKIIAEIKGDTQ